MPPGLYSFKLSFSTVKIDQLNVIRSNSYFQFAVTPSLATHLKDKRIIPLLCFTGSCISVWKPLQSPSVVCLRGRSPDYSPWDITGHYMIPSQQRWTATRDGSSEIWETSPESAVSRMWTLLYQLLCDLTPI